MLETTFLQPGTTKLTMWIFKFNSDCRSAVSSEGRGHGQNASGRCWYGAALAAAAFFTLGATASADPREAGIWYDDTGKGAVEIFECGTNLCGRIVWLKDPLNAKGEPLRDGYNPNPTLRARTICGLQILGGLAAQPDGTWDEGWVYDPKVGKSYNAALQVAGQNLILTGYKGVRLFSKSFKWTKAPETLPKCDMSTTAAR